MSGRPARRSGLTSGDRLAIGAVLILLGVVVEQVELLSWVHAPAIGVGLAVALFGLVDSLTGPKRGGP